ncbi:MAG: hypothetical protein M1829_004618 [Trizodia sp. TS-e1964]|nr:MAG: hypothetical protein M1829_004618 [Trizodia sp. TS-e1964]
MPVKLTSGQFYSRAILGSSNQIFARQLAERTANDGPPKAKKFRSSAVPKGTKLASGYSDRTQHRVSAEDDDKFSRVSALENMVKLGQLDQKTFENLRDEVVGGEISSTHLVKGLDYKLLERVKRGEDLILQAFEGNRPVDTNPSTIPPRISDSDFDRDIDEFEAIDVPHKQGVPATKNEKGFEIPSPSTVGRKRTRDQILADLKASRLAKPGLSLGTRFKKIGPPKEKTRIERNEHGREILITTNPDGSIKRKVRKSDMVKATESDGSLVNGGVSSLLVLDKHAKRLGMEAPVPLKQPTPASGPEEESQDIFWEAGKDYNPLASLGDDSAEEGTSSESEKPRPRTKPSRSASERNGSPAHISPNSEIDIQAPLFVNSRSQPHSRNYFSESTIHDITKDPDSQLGSINSLSDPSILAALRKASSLNPLSSNSANSSLPTDEDTARILRHQKLLSATKYDRDAEDMDLEFGSSRFEDQADGETLDTKVKLSLWDDAAGGRLGGEKCSNNNGSKGGHKRAKRR